jgi:hypothetical protein
MSFTSHRSCTAGSNYNPQNVPLSPNEEQRIKVKLNHPRKQKNIIQREGASFMMDLKKIRLQQ